MRVVPQTEIYGHRQWWFEWTLGQKSMDAGSKIIKFVYTKHFLLLMSDSFFCNIVRKTALFQVIVLQAVYPEEKVI